MNVTVVIPTKGRHTELCDALRSIAQQTVSVAQVIVVDASLQPAELGVLQSMLRSSSQPPELIYRWEPASPGLTAQRNIAASLAKGDIVQFLDDDATLDPHYLKNLLPVFDDAPVAGAAGLVVDPAIGGRLLKRLFFRLFHWGAFRQMREELYMNPPLTVMPTNILPGVSAYRRRILTEYSFDENLIGAGLGEDIEFSYRVGKKWHLVIQPSALVHHRSSPLGRQPLRLNFAERVRFYHYHFRKNMAGTLAEWLTYLWLNLGLFLDACSRLQSAPVLGFVDGWRTVIARGVLVRPAPPSSELR